MKEILKIYDLKDSSDTNKIQRAITNNEGVLACEFSISKKEVQIIYNDSIVTLDNIIESIELLGYMVL